MAWRSLQPCGSPGVAALDALCAFGWFGHHLPEPLAFWDYCKASAYYLFGDRLADLNAQKILDALRTHPAGMTRKETLDEVFQRHISKEPLDFAFATLERLELARKEIEQTAGRPLERWFLAQ